MKIINIVGTRPNFIKISPLIKEIKNNTSFNSLLLHTGQHYDNKMSESFFSELKIPKPNIFLDTGSDTQAKQVAKIMQKFDDVCDNYKPDVVLVVGDVNSTMACTLVAQKRGITTIHVEAGIRSGDKGMPEEINRIVTDAICDYLLPPTIDAVDNLLREGRKKDEIILVGNIMIDTMFNFKEEINLSSILSRLNLKETEYATLTLHRPSNVDDKRSIMNIFGALSEIQKEIIIIFPIHPRTKKMIKIFKLENYIAKMENVVLLEPLGYFDFGKLISNSKFVLTDSGGIQEETTIYGVPCITLRTNTERQITITEGTNELAGTNTKKIISLSQKILDDNWKTGYAPYLWDGKTAMRIVKFLSDISNNVSKA